MQNIKFCPRFHILVNICEVMYIINSTRETQKSEDCVFRFLHSIKNKLLKWASVIKFGIV